MDLKERIQQLEKEVQQQEEQHKAQIIHTETIGMMTKYQLVFIKLETSLSKLDMALRLRLSPVDAIHFYIGTSPTAALPSTEFKISELLRSRSSARRRACLRSS